MAARTTKRKTKKKTTRRATTRSKTTARKKTTKRPATRKTAKRTAKKTTTRAVASPKPAKITASKDGRTKTEVYGIMADHAGITKKEVAAVFETMQEMIKKDLSKAGSGEFKIPGMMKILVQRKPAVARRKGVNPFTGEEQWFKAKPARNVVKVRPMKGLKDLV
jgi:nucleoid DNA-binding protein